MSYGQAKNDQTHSTASLKQQPITVEFDRVSRVGLFTLPVGRRSGSSRSRSPSRRPSKPWIDVSAATAGRDLGNRVSGAGDSDVVEPDVPQPRAVDYWWLSWLRRGFGWGAYVMPLVFGTVGLGLLMYGFGRLPSVRGERVIGLAADLLYGSGSDAPRRDGP